MDDFSDWIQKATAHWPAWAATVITGVLGLVGAVVAAWMKSRSAERVAQIVADQERLNAQQATEAEQGKELTARLKALFNGYEVRIADLTTELAEVRRLHDTKLHECMICPYKPRPPDAHTDSSSS